MARLTPVRFYFDEDLLGLAHVVSSLRTDSTYPGDPGAVIKKRQRPACMIDRGTKDPVWLPAVAQAGWLIVTRDHNIRENPAERHAVRDSGGRLVALSGKEAATTWEQLELLMMRWRRIEALLDEPGPFIYLASRSRFQQLELDD